MILASALLLSLLACGGDGDGPSTPSPPEAPVDVESLLASMTLEEKVGQMTQVDRQYLDSEDDIRRTLEVTDVAFAKVRASFGET